MARSLRALLALLSACALIACVVAQTTPVKPEPLPHALSQCGQDNLTVLGDGRVDDYQLTFVSDNNQIIYLRTDEGRVYRSGDEGVTWVEQTKNAILAHSEDAPMPVSQILSHESKDNKVTLYLLGASGSSRMWVSDDGGLTYTVRDTLPRGVFHVYPHPLYSRKLLARRVNEKKPLQHEIWRSDDAAASWRKLIDDVPAHAPVQWSPLADTHPDRIYATRTHVDANTTNRYAATLVFSDDSFATQQRLELPVPLASTSVLYWWLMAPKKLLLVSCVDPTCSSRELYLSDDSAKTFTRAVFPREQRDAAAAPDFRVYELSDDALWIEVPRVCTPSSGGGSGDKPCDSDLFHSNGLDRDFTLALERSLPWEFTKYYGTEGIYIANQFSDAEHSAVRSLITYNKGSQWHALAAPALDAQGQPTHCDAARGCSLHVHGYAAGDAFTWFYSVPNAPGIMVANGNLGLDRDTHADHAAVYYSRNGGVNWTQVAAGPHVPEIGDHGAAVVLVPVTEGRELLYSVSDGDEWLHCAYTATAMQARNIRVSQGWDSRRFLLYGRRKNAATGKEETVLVHLNLDSAFTKGACSDQRGDYEQWSPVDEHGQCVLGTHTVVKRRRAGRACYLPEQHVYETREGACACDADDYECAHCFYRPSLQAPCTLECLVPDLPAEPRALCQQPGAAYWETDMGYRLVDGNGCDSSLPGSLKPKARVPCGFPRPDVVDAPPTSSGGGVSVAALVVVLVALVVLALVGTVLYLWRYNDSFYNAVSYSLGVDNCFGRGGSVDVTVYDAVLANAGGSLLQDDDKIKVRLDDSDGDA